MVEQRTSENQLCERHGAIVETGCPACEAALGRTELKSSNEQCEHESLFTADVMVRECKICHQVVDHPWKEEVERLTQALEVETVCHQSASNSNHDKRKEIKRLRAALLKYGQHTHGCADEQCIGPCDCGFRAALRGAEETKETLPTYKEQPYDTGTIEGMRRYIFEQLGFLTDDDNRPAEAILRLARKRLSENKGGT